jgi:hypothetical protein
MSRAVGTQRAQEPSAVQGRITERQLPLAEQSSPGIRRFYDQLDAKPATFLQLLWAFEGSRQAVATPRKRRAR